jgi:Heterokaryon incompatibility protein (HET)
MWLLSTNADGSFSRSRFANDDIPGGYAILSHTWEANDQEVTFQDMTNGSGWNKYGYRKIQFCRDQAKRDGLQYFWVDSCCVNQLSSAELSTAINSMFRWYQDAAKCYVYLSDVSTGKDTQSSKLSWESAFYRSRWFTRGWTLQELLAPASVEFFSQEGMRLGDKESLKLQIQQITGVPIQALQGDQLSQIGIDRRLSWIANRDTTIEEDIAYSIFGLFDIHLPLIYGEGATKALRRLGEEIEKSSKLSQYGKPTLYDQEDLIANL